MARSILLCTDMIGLKSIKRKYDHISKCWTLISKGRSRCLSILYWINTDINGIVLVLQWFRCIVFFNLIQLSELDYFLSKGELQSSVPYLKNRNLHDKEESIKKSHEIVWRPRARVMESNSVPHQRMNGCTSSHKLGNKPAVPQILFLTQQFSAVRLLH